MEAATLEKIGEWTGVELVSNPLKNGLFYANLMLGFMVLVIVIPFFITGAYNDFSSYRSLLAFLFIFVPLSWIAGFIRGYSGAYDTAHSRYDWHGNSILPPKISSDVSKGSLYVVESGIGGIMSFLWKDIRGIELVDSHTVLLTRKERFAGIPVLLVSIKLHFSVLGDAEEFLSLVTMRL